jgi:hypothetical protein
MATSMHWGDHRGCIKNISKVYADKEKNNYLN